MLLGQPMGVSEGIMDIRSVTIIEVDRWLGRVIL